MIALLLFLALLAFLLACFKRTAGAAPWLPIGLAIWVGAELLGAGGLGALGN